MYRYLIFPQILRNAALQQQQKQNLGGTGTLETKKPYEVPYRYTGGSGEVPVRIPVSGSYNRLGWYWPASCFSAKLASTSRLERKTDVLSTPSYIITVTSVVLDANKLCLEPDQEICPYLDSSTALSHNYIISFENESEKYFNNNLFIEKHEESYELRWWIFNHQSDLFPFFIV